MLALDDHFDALAMPAVGKRRESIVIELSDGRHVVKRDKIMFNMMSKGATYFGHDRLWPRPVLATVSQAARGFHHDNLRVKTSTFEVPTDHNTTKIPREDPQREEKRHEKIPRERRKE